MLESDLSEAADTLLSYPFPPSPSPSDCPAPMFRRLRDERPVAPVRAPDGVTSD